MHLSCTSKSWWYSLSVMGTNLTPLSLTRGGLHVKLRPTLTQHASQQTLHKGKTSAALYSEKLTQNSAYWETRQEFWMLAITSSHHINENAEGA